MQSACEIPSIPRVLIADDEPELLKVLEGLLKELGYFVVSARNGVEAVEYAADAVTEGHNKALIVIGHISSEQAGMEECTRWLDGFIRSVPIEFVPAKQPFWLAIQK